MRLTNHSRTALSCCLLGLAFLCVLFLHHALDVGAAPASAPALQGPASGSAVEAAGLVIVTWSYFQEGATLYVVGEVRNDTVMNATAVTVTATYFDSAENVLGTASARTEHEILIPGKISPFVILDEYPAGLASCTLSLQAEPAAEDPVPPLSIVSMRRLPGPSEGLTLVGVLANTTGVTVTNAKVIVTLYDAGTVINAQSDFAFNRLLVPGQESPFRVIVGAGPIGTEDPLISTEASPSTAVPADLHSVQVQWHLDDQDALHWTGTVENRGSTEASLVRAMVTLYDDADAVVNVGVDLTDPSTIPAGGEAAFDISVPEAFAGWTRYRLYPPEVAGPTPTPTTSPTATAAPTVTPTPTATATGTVTPTPTETPPGDLWMTGYIYDAAGGPSSSIAGAAVAVQSCLPHQPFDAQSGADGYYEVLLPAQYLNPCTSVTLFVAATGYHSYSQVVTVAELRAVPRRDFGLEALPTPTPGPGTRLYLPLVRRKHQPR